MTRIICISDTHGFYEQVVVPPGDILIHSGDFGQRGHLSELPRFHDWMASQPHAYKIFVAGNHDWCFEQEPKKSRALMKNVIYLQDSSVEILGLQIYGSPWQPRFFDWAFNLDRGQPLRKIWNKIPPTTDILVTHGPPFGIGDRTARGLSVGCEDLLSRLSEVKPRLHCFGHIHEGRGMSTVGETIYVNASICDERYTPRHEAITVEVVEGGSSNK
jgi:Icc-related predicted phosphoesterase